MPAPSLRRALVASGLATACIGLTACQPDSPFGEDQPEPQILVASPVYTQNNASADAQLRALRTALERLRSETGSGWTGRQDDGSGYLAELSGGRFGDGAAEETVDEFVDSYGLDLFGVGGESLEAGEASGADVTGAATVRADQVVGDVPVVDAQLVFTLAERGSASALTAVRGQVFPQVDVDTTPGLTAGRATRSAERESGGESAAPAELVVLPDGAGVLAWEVPIIGTDASGGDLSPGDGTYYVDAQNGDLLDVRPASASFGAGAASLAPIPARAEGGSPVEVTGTDALGESLTATGREGGDGVELVDETLPWFDAASGAGAIETYTAQDTENAPGQLYTERSTEIRNPDAIAAHAWSRIVLDYYAGLGRASWDGEGGTMLSTVDVGDDSFCNAMFRHEPPQMIYGNPCAGPGGLVQLTTLDVAGHEITHGVIESTSGLVYSGQSGALNESFADYFGNVIGNAHRGTDTSSLGEDACAQVTQPQNLCSPTNDGGLATREMLNGSTFGDFLRLLTPNFRTRVLGDDADHGGVHLNSAIWNNALWSIRTRLAQIDGTSGNESELAGDFDKIVYAAMTTQLSPAASFFDARAAIEQVARDAGADATIQRVIREVFDENQICVGCYETGTVNGQVVSAAPQSQIEPSVSGDQVSWVDSSQGGFGFGFPAVAGLDGEASSLATAPDTVQVVFAGDSVVTLELSLESQSARVVRYDGGAAEPLAEATDSTLLTGIAGSDDGAAWVTQEQGTVSFVTPDGTVTTEDLPNLGGDTITAMGAGSGQVALGTEGGRTLLWEPGGGFTELGTMTSTVVSVATFDGRVLAVDDNKAAGIFHADGLNLQLSSNAAWSGAALNGEYAVWAEEVGSLSGPIAEQYGGVADTDLYLYSLRTGTIYNLLSQTGQQGYPAISGDRLVWQDTVFGNNDIFTATLPSGL